MDHNQNHINRRSFLKAVGSVGLTTVLASARANTDPNKADPNKDGKTPKFPQVPTRILGRTGIKVPCLSLGRHGAEAGLLFRKALDYGINYWDASYVAAGGNSEISIGKYIETNPDIRKKLFLTTKAPKTDKASELEKCLQISLERMKTDYVDLYFGLYMMSDPAQLSDEIKNWVKDAKQRKLIRYFGFTTHQNMADCLSAAAKVDWIDVIMTSYNFRLMHDPQMQQAVDACHKAGVAIIAMKTQGKPIEAEEDKKLIEHFLKRGFTEGQAKIKAVLEDQRISSACVAMNSINLLNSNIAAVLDKTELIAEDKIMLKEFASANRNKYCTGCSNICESQIPCVSDIMRCLMYHNSYGSHEMAKELFAQIPAYVKTNLLHADYGFVESRCPQRLPIARLVAEAFTKLA